MIFVLIRRFKELEEEDIFKLWKPWTTWPIIQGPKEYFTLLAHDSRSKENPRLLDPSYKA